MTNESICLNVRCSIYKPRPGTPFFMATAATHMTYAEEPRTKLFLIQKTAITGAPTHSKATVDSQRGHADWRGQCVASQKNLNSFKHLIKTSWPSWAAT